MRSLVATLALWCALLSGPLQAQTLVLEEHCDTFPVVLRYGPNRQHYTHFWASVGLPLWRGEHQRYLAWRSPQFRLGFRYKYRLSEHLALAADLSYQWQNHFLRQDSAKYFPDTLRHRREIFRLHDLGAALAVRINLGIRGDMIGKYLDFGFRASTRLWSTYLRADELPGGLRVRTLTRGLPWYHRWQYSAFLRAGWGWLALCAEWRLSRLFQPGIQAPEPAALSLSLEFKF